MNIIKKILSVVLSFVLAAGLIVVSDVEAGATSGSVKVDGLYYDILPGDETVEVTMPEGWDTYSGEIIIPEKIEIGEGEARKEYTVVGIGDSAFLNSRDLENVVIPDTVTYIGFSAFSGCYNLAGSPTDGIVIPDSVDYIGSYAFYACENIKNIKLSSNINIIYDHTFDGCESLEKISIPDGVTSIGESAFGFCYKLKDITFPAELGTIGNDAFYGHGALKVDQITFKEANPPTGVDALKDISFSRMVVPEVSKEKYAALGFNVDEIIGDPSLNPEEKASDNPDHTHNWTYGTIYEATESSDGLEGESCSCGATRNTSVIPKAFCFVNKKY